MSRDKYHLHSYTKTKVSKGRGEDNTTHWWMCGSVIEAQKRRDRTTSNRLNYLHNPRLVLTNLCVGSSSIRVKRS